MRSTTEAFVRECLPSLKDEYNKFDRGRLFLAAGSCGMAGAVILAGRAAMRSGVGYLDIAVPEAIYPIVTAAIPEAVCSIYDPADLPGMRQILRKGIGKADAVAAGCGLGALRSVVTPAILASCDKKLLLDADGLNYLSEACSRTGGNDEMPEELLPSSAEGRELVLTPHSGEMGRLLGVKSAEVERDREKAVRSASERFGATVLLKGHRTLIADPSGLLFMNETGNPGMARAGSGDTLTGIIGAFLAQGMSGREAAVCGAYVHGLAGDLAAEKYGMRSMLPTDLIEMIPEALMQIEAQPGSE